MRFEATTILGWLSSLILLLTLGSQVLKQWREKRVGGVSRWLFIGQLTASVGFTSYSILVGNWVFAVTNGLLLVNALLGLIVDRQIRRRHPPVARP